MSRMLSWRWALLVEEAIRSCDKSIVGWIRSRGIRHISHSCVPEVFRGPSLSYFVGMGAERLAFLSGTCQKSLSLVEVFLQMRLQRLCNEWLSRLITRLNAGAPLITPNYLTLSMVRVPSFEFFYFYG
jgi:hypothetical protein